MPNRLMLALLTASLLASCSGDGGTPDGSNHDGIIQVGDGPVFQDCTPDADDCTGGLACLCCNSAGPSQECLCTTPCTEDQDCTDPDRPDCNQPGVSQEGICAPIGFGCCWFCL